MTNFTAPTNAKAAGKVTPKDASEHPWFYLAFDGPGRPAAERSRCTHGYPITDSCPNCP